MPQSFRAAAVEHNHYVGTAEVLLPAVFAVAHVGAGKDIPQARTLDHLAQNRGEFSHQILVLVAR